MSTTTISYDGVSEEALVHQDIVEAVASRLDLRAPNKEALESIAAVVADHYEVAESEETFEGVVDVATGVGKTYITAAALEYFATLGARNFAVIAPGRTILEKTVANFTAGHKKAVAGMDVKPVVITSENFDGAANAAVMNDDSNVKLFVFTVQSLLKPTTAQGRKTHEFREGLGSAFYAHLQGLDDLIVFADEHHAYYGDAFSKAIRELHPYALIGLTATPHKKTKDEDIIYRYPLAAAIADRLVKTPVVVGRRDDRNDVATKLNDGITLLETKRQAVDAYVKAARANGEMAEQINPVMLVITPKIEDAKEIATLLRQTVAGGNYAKSVLEVHSKATGETREKMLAALDQVEDPTSHIRIIVSVGMLKEGWDVKNVYVVASLRASISELLTEQTLGRGMRLPFGRYTDIEMLDTLEVLAHDRYEKLLRKTGVLNQAFVDYRTRAVLKKNMHGQVVATTETTEIDAPVHVSDDGKAAGETGATVVAADDRTNAGAEGVTKLVELKPDPEHPTIELPQFAVGDVESDFSLADLIDLDAFKKLGERLATDPAKEFRRERLSATIEIGPDGLSRTKLVTGQAVDRIAASTSKLSLDEVRKELLKRIYAAEVAIQRPKETKAAKKIIEAFISGFGDKAEDVLSAYLATAAGSLIRKLTDEQRRAAKKPSYKEIVEFKTFETVRLGRQETSRDRTGKFQKGVGYEGWKRSLYSQVWFDSATERVVATTIDDTDEINVWVRLHNDDLPITWEGGSYNPDFLAVDSDGTHWLIEPKMEKEMQSAAVKAKKAAAERWASHVSNDEKANAEWRYLLLSESDVAGAKGSWAALKGLGSS